MRSDTIVLFEDLIESQPFHSIFEVLRVTEVFGHPILELLKRELEGVPHVSFTLDDIALAPEPFGVMAGLLEGPVVSKSGSRLARPAISSPAVNAFLGFRTAKEYTDGRVVSLLDGSIDDERTGMINGGC